MRTRRTEAPGPRGACDAPPDAADPLAALEDWYLSRCNGEWEHHAGITIQTLDNPGWWVKVNLTGTPLSSRPFEPIQRRARPDDWLDCKIEDHTFHGAGDARKLRTILDIFLKWAAQNQ